MISELDLVALTHDIEGKHLKAGDVGTVVAVYSESEAYEVEFVTFSGDTVAVVTLPANSVRPLHSREVASARLLAQS
jgi:hypothetical protein